MTVIADVFPKWWTPKNVVRSTSKKSVSQDPLKSNMENTPKYVEIWMETHFPYLLIAVNAIVLQKVSLSDIQNLKNVSELTESL